MWPAAPVAERLPHLLGGDAEMLGFVLVVWIVGRNSFLQDGTVVF